MIAAFLLVVGLSISRVWRARRCGRGHADEALGDIAFGECVSVKIWRFSAIFAVITICSTGEKPDAARAQIARRIDQIARRRRR
ncbi:hypothetical protein B1812_15040 [Methylocystis bryophila]|uniref:Uncharacterized protein n=1 Tax=Methylocystis bryophila TaxID=655015 RepID=A0A1W6MX85_9HYPH|nr:hypothetical protein B1812_15040 [Methylocystis bryophila]